MKAYLSLALFFEVRVLSHAQGSFTNLDFESANLAPVSHGFELVADALPGWTYFHGDEVQTYISRNGFGSGGQSGATIFERAIWPIPLGGRFFLLFTRDFRDSTPTSIAQAGVVPQGSMSLRFLVALTPWIPGDMAVQLNGTELQLQVLGFGAYTTLIGADVSAFAGQTAELRFVSNPYRDSGEIQTYLDNIEFSPEPIPEPAASVIFVLAGLWFGWRHSRRRRAQNIL